MMHGVICPRKIRAFCVATMIAIFAIPLIIYNYYFSLIVLPFVSYILFVSFSSNVEFEFFENEFQIGKYSFKYDDINYIYDDPGLFFISLNKKINKIQIKNFINIKYRSVSINKFYSYGYRDFIDKIAEMKIKKRKFIIRRIMYYFFSI